MNNKNIRGIKVYIRNLSYVMSFREDELIKYGIDIAAGNYMIFTFLLNNYAAEVPLGNNLFD
jgi:hypothetical protein